MLHSYTCARGHMYIYHIWAYTVLAHGILVSAYDFFGPFISQWLRRVSQGHEMYPP